jgi:hypothetical protein
MDKRTKQLIIRSEGIKALAFMQRFSGAPKPLTLHLRLTLLITVQKFFASD